MSRKTFMTKDLNGCEFQVEAYYSNKHFDLKKDNFVIDADYYAMGLHTKDLNELKKLVSKL